MNQDSAKLEQFKHEHDLLYREGQLLWDKIELISTRIFALREKIATMEGDDYDAIEMLFRGTFERLEK